MRACSVPPSITTTAWGYVTRETDPNGNVTTTDYDSTYHQFPVKVCADPDVINLCTYTYYYSVNPNASVPSGGVRAVWAGAKCQGS